MSITPGPWTWTDNDDLRLIAANGKEVLSVHESHGGGNFPKTDDANVIAAAPDLLTALTEALAKYDEALARDYMKNSTPWSVAARAAIAKAHGRAG